MQAHECSHFAYELNSMLERTAFSAEVVVAELNRQGFPLPLRTFKYWLQGYFLPRFDSAFQLIVALESICGITDSRLADALVRDLSSNYFSLPDEIREQGAVPSPPMDMDVTYSQYFKVIEGEVDWSADLVRKAVKDDVYVSEDFTQFRHRVTVLAVVPDVPNPSLTISCVYEPGEYSINDEHFYDIKGVSSSKQGSYEEDGLIVHGQQLYLPDDVVPGALHEISYTWDYAVPAPTEKMGERMFPWLLEFYSCTLTFEGNIPQKIEYVTYTSAEEQNNPAPSDIPIIRDGHSVSIMANDFGHLMPIFGVLPSKRQIRCPNYQGGCTLVFTR